MRASSRLEEAFLGTELSAPHHAMMRLTRARAARVASGNPRAKPAPDTRRSAPGVGRSAPGTNLSIRCAPRASRRRCGTLGSTSTGATISCDRSRDRGGFGVHRSTTTSFTSCRKPDVGRRSALGARRSAPGGRHPVLGFRRPIRGPASGSAVPAPAPSPALQTRRRGARRANDVPQRCAPTTCVTTGAEGARPPPARPRICPQHTMAR